LFYPAKLSEQTVHTFMCLARGVHRSPVSTLELKNMAVGNLVGTLLSGMNT